MSTRGHNGKHSDADGKHSEPRHIEANDILSVGSRISWGAVLAGAAVALACMVALYMLGVATGMSTHRIMADRTLFIGAMIWYTFSTLFALFIGGVVVSRCTAGEDKTEAFMYGLVLWGVTFVGVASLAAAGINVGSSTVVLRQESRLAGGNLPGDAAPRAEAKAAEVKADLNNGAPEVSPTAVAWWSFFGVILSMVAAVGGSLAGAGPTLVLRQIRLRRAATLAETRASALPTP